ncbi:MAG: hypothetical protein QXH91_00480 [Candidatus Bathyarchaeia archaeon]
MSFPKRIYTRREVRLAKDLIDKGHRHRLRIIGNLIFKEKAMKVLKLVKTAGYYDFLRTYIRRIREIDGLSQLREEEASIWVNMHLVEDSVDAASFFIQKAWQMKNYIEGKIYYERGEAEALDSRIKFLEALKRLSEDPQIKKECEKRLKMWNESKFL